MNQNLVVKLCNKLDPNCVAPLSCSHPDTACPTPLSSLIPDAMGNVSATITSSTNAYLDISDTTSTYLPMVVFIDLVAAAEYPRVNLISKQAWSGLAAVAKITLDPTASVLLVPVVDCTSTRTAGVSVALSPQGSATEYYNINSAVVTTATKTDSSGQMGFVNVAAPGTVTLTGTVAATGKEMGKVTTLVRPGGATYQVLRPSTNL
jgi:hypothetical protein